MSKLLQIVVLAIVQGVTEFLPISSSGHLLIGQKLMLSGSDPVLVAVVLHFGTLFSIVAYYFRDIICLLKEEKRDLMKMIILGTIPVVVLGVPIKLLMDFMESQQSLIMFVVAGSYLLSFVLLVFVFKRGERTLDEMTWKDAVCIGLMQCIAILPGVSRSGSTISLAGRRGLSADGAAKYSFFLGILAIGLAVCAKAKDLYAMISQKTQPNGEMFSIFELGIGFVVSFGVGYVSLAVLIHILKKGKMSYFGYYCLAMAILATVLGIREVLSGV